MSPDVGTPAHTARAIEQLQRAVVTAPPGHLTGADSLDVVIEDVWSRIEHGAQRRSSPLKSGIALTRHWGSGARS
jgi:hypothetical protein